MFKDELWLLQLLECAQGVVRLLDYGRFSTRPEKRKPGDVDVHILECLELSELRFFQLPTKAMLKLYFRKLIEARPPLITMIISACLTCERRHVVHHDIKEGNVILTKDLSVVLIDFDHGGVATTDYTWESHCTNGFDPPERARMNEDEPTYVELRKIDVWCVGIMLFQALVGVVPKTNEMGAAIGEVLQRAPVGQLLESFFMWTNSNPR